MAAAVRRNSGNRPIDCAVGIRVELMLPPLIHTVLPEGLFNQVPAATSTLVWSLMSLLRVTPERVRCKSSRCETEELAGEMSPDSLTKPGASGRRRPSR
jgi:hypothetical protein